MKRAGSSDVVKVSRTGQFEAGNAILMALLLISLLAALATAQFAVMQKGAHASAFFARRAELRKDAESGIELALHDLTYGVTGQEGKVGCASWTVASDAGSDGMPGTGDAGEGDGLPTPGEANVAPQAIGSSLTGAGLVVHVEDSSYPGVKRIVATAAAGDNSAQIEVFASKTDIYLPRVGAIYLDPNVVIDLNSNAFSIDGHDTNPDGSPGPAAAVLGVATKTGSPAGANAATLLGQIPSRLYNQIDGAGGTPSIGEADVDFQALLSALKELVTHEVVPGTMTESALGDAEADDYRVVHVAGDLHLSGDIEGAGILLVEGSLTLTGQFSYQGLVMVAGDVRMSGTGTEAKVVGSLMVGQSIVTDETLFARSRGAARVYYSSAALSKVEGMLKPHYRMLYYAED